MSRVLEIVTPENVTIRYELAGFGTRGVAAMIDWGLQLILIFLLFCLYLMCAWLQLLPTLTDAEEMVKSYLLALAILVFFLVMWGYHVLFEALWNGQTPGKRWLGLRVIKDGGYPVDFRAAVIRNLVRAVDILPALPGLPSYGLAFVAVLASAHYKRLGDMAAGTLVVRHGREEVNATRNPGFGKAVVFRLLDTAFLSQLFRLSREEYRMVQHYLERRNDLPSALRGEFARRLAEPLIEKFDYRAPELGMDYDRWLEELDLAYRNRALGTTTPLSTAPPPLAAAAPLAPEEAMESAPARKW
ncbi:MAG TPA: RDD family protein [Armatimonadota bacterium]